MQMARWILVLSVFIQGFSAKAEDGYTTNRCAPLLEAKEDYLRWSRIASRIERNYNEMDPAARRQALRIALAGSSGPLQFLAKFHGWTDFNPHFMGLNAVLERNDRGENVELLMLQTLRNMRAATERAFERSSVSLCESVHNASFDSDQDSSRR